jgi:hypothetical protein
MQLGIPRTPLFRKIVEALNEIFKVTAYTLPLFCFTYHVKGDRREINIKPWSENLKEIVFLAHLQE